MATPELVIRVDGVKVPAVVSEGRTHRAVGGGDYAQLTFDVGTEQEGLDWQAEFQLSALYQSKEHAIFTGWVESAAFSQIGWQIRLVTAEQQLREIRLGGTDTHGPIDTKELVWSILRSSGFPEDRIDIEGFEPGPPEMFEVASPLDGIRVAEPRRIGKVQVFGEGPAKELAGELGPDELHERYTSADAWAYTVVRARTLFEAEQLGLASIDVAVSWLGTITRYSTPTRPDGVSREYRREWTITRISRRDAVFVRGLATQRTWLRAPGVSVDRPVLQLDELSDVDAFSSPAQMTKQDTEALRALRRSFDSPDSLSAAIALNEALEFYSAGSHVDPMFSSDELAAVRERASHNLDAARTNRVAQALGRVNEPSLMAKLEHAADLDGAPLGERQLAFLKRVRNARNDAVHGRTRPVPSDQDIRLAIAIVSRLLIFRAARRSSEPPGRS